MIGISKLYCGTVEPSDVLRYRRRSKELPSGLLQFSKDKKPVVVWNCTRTCNLKCEHCYALSDAQKYDQLSTAEAKAMIESQGGKVTGSVSINTAPKSNMPDISS